MSGLACITRRSPVASALWLVVTLFSLAALFVLLDAQFIAVLQVLVYAGAIMVLFLFVIMLLNRGPAGPTDLKGPAGLGVGVLLAGGLFVQLLGLGRAAPSPGLVLPPGAVARAAAEQGMVPAVARPLFAAYLVPFEITSILLLAAMVGAVVNGTLALARPTAKRAVSIVGVGTLVLAFAAAAIAVAELARHHATAPLVFRYWEWIPVGDLQVAFALQLDQLAAVMILVVTGVGALIHVFSVGYMHEDPGYARYFAYLNLFVFFMLILVLGANFPVMFVGWEGVGLCSYLLIGFWFNEQINADAGQKAFILNRLGDFGFLVAMFLIFTRFGSLDFETVFAKAPADLMPGGAVATTITLFLFLGCTGKSAQVPLYTWLPDAMQGPTPVSALIHAATMVTAGVYLVARCGVLFALSPVGSATVAGVGAVTALFAATIALKQWDIKRVLAYSTVSQLGYMFLGVGTGAYAAGIFHLTTHAFFKALLFLGSGSVIHAMHRAYHATHAHEDAQDMCNMGGLARYMPWTATLMWIATLAIAGIPPLAGFFSKAEILGAAFAQGAGRPVWYVFWGMGLAAALLTAFYMTRLMLYTFHG